LILDEILRAAKAKGLNASELAERTGVRAELVSRMRRRGTADFAVIEKMANEVGLQLHLTPADSTLDLIRRGEFLP